MAVIRDFPYAQFNFLVDLGTGSTDGPQAGFQECSEIAMFGMNGSVASRGPRISPAWNKWRK